MGLDMYLEKTKRVLKERSENELIGEDSSNKKRFLLW